MSYYSKTLPNLIEPQMEQNVLENIGLNINKKTFSENISVYMAIFYTNYLKRYFLISVIIIIIILFLLYRYYDNKDKKKYRAQILAMKREEQLRNIEKILNRKVTEEKIKNYNDIVDKNISIEQNLDSNVNLDPHITFDSNYYNYANFNFNNNI